MKKLFENESVKGGLHLILKSIKEIYEANFENKETKKEQILYNDLFFLENNWKNNITDEMKKYPLAILFLFKYEDCERELKFYLEKTDLITNFLYFCCCIGFIPQIFL